MVQSGAKGAVLFFSSDCVLWRLRGLWLNLSVRDNQQPRKTPDASSTCGAGFAKLCRIRGITAYRRAV